MYIRLVRNLVLIVFVDEMYDALRYRFFMVLVSILDPIERDLDGQMKPKSSNVKRCKGMLYLT